jgi:Zn-dependent protease
MEDLNTQHVMLALLKLGVLIFSLSLHEFGHAFAAYRLGDPTAQMLGRLTIDPRAHADPFGTILFPLLSLLTGMMFIGWAKPVPVSKENFKHPRRDDILVSTAGPGMNLLLSVLSAGLMAVFLATNRFGLEAGMAGQVAGLLRIFFWLNFSLAVFNLLPIPPLDGSWVLKALLPPKWSHQVSRLDPYGILILLVALYAGVIGAVFGPAFWLLDFIFQAAGWTRLSDALVSGAI